MLNYLETKIIFTSIVTRFLFLQLPNQMRASSGHSNLMPISGLEYCRTITIVGLASIEGDQERVEERNWEHASSAARENVTKQYVSICKSSAWASIWSHKRWQ